MRFFHLFHVTMYVLASRTTVKYHNITHALDAEEKGDFWRYICLLGKYPNRVRF